MKNIPLTLAMILAYTVHAPATPLHDAAENGTATDVTALLEAGADPKAWNKTGKTPWDYAKENEALKGTDAYWRLRP